MKHNPEGMEEEKGPLPFSEGRLETETALPPKLFGGLRRLNSDEAAFALPDDVLLAVFSLLPRCAVGVGRCAAVCRHWRRLISHAPLLRWPRLPPRGFFHHHPQSPLPAFFPAAASAELDLSFVPVGPSCGAFLDDCRGGCLLLRDHRSHGRELDLLVCDPSSRTSLRLPSIYAAGHCLDTCAIVPAGQGAGFRVAVVFFAAAHYDVLVYSSDSGKWDAASGRLHRPLKALPGPSVLVGDVLYKMQGDCGCILAVDVATIRLSAVSTPCGAARLHAGNHWIGKTADEKLFFFELRKPLSLLGWVLEDNGKWAACGAIELGACLDPAAVGELASTKLSAHVADQLHGCELVSINGFCEVSGVLFLCMANRVVSLDLGTKKMEMLWHNTDHFYPTGVIYPY